MDPHTHDIFKSFLIWLIPALPAITLHECAHGWMALYLGDTTARDARRLSLNPLRHVDPVGTIIVPVLMLLAHVPFIFGWAKPVPVDFRRLRNGRSGMILVALAGPLANLVMMLFWMVVVIVLVNIGKDSLTVSTAKLAFQVGLFGVGINLVLMLFNLMPIPPLDGGRIVSAILPEVLSRPYMRIERFGILIVMLLTATGAFSLVFDPLLDFVFSHMGIM